MKRPAGLIVIMIIKIVFGIMAFLMVTFLFSGVLSSSPIRMPVDEKIKLGILSLVAASYLALYITSAVFLLRLKNWARKISLFDMIITLIILLFFMALRLPDILSCGIMNAINGLIMPVLLVSITSWSIFYITRSDVKGQFK